ncbi:S-formylglutathione hydrolase [Rheinheimera sp. MM224]|uniref:S-formylglutathione hydrolase n=1 Tax=Rheinheimera sp. MM224 TaxID=3019969 RepID=UPI0021F8EC54|nr:S-formylglutathione hydrolase [Rheinheimera sp. MM224]CAI3801273.1 S-formylglutathione hydrolase YeiG [Rheinheimera sp. MM224]
MTLIQLSEHKLFAGRQIKYQHHSDSVKGVMHFSVYLPPAAEKQKVPVLYWLSGLTCTDENFSVKAGAQRVAAELGIALVIPDTSPRGEQVADDAAYDLGQGAGFYVNATQEPWAAHYQMYDYISRELPSLVEAHLPVTSAKAISGHSMGGHGALVIALREAGAYRSVSAFSPICQPSECDWGKKAFTAYLGDEQSQWLQYDASFLLAQKQSSLPMLIDQGEGDQFYPSQLRTESLMEANQRSQSGAQIRLQSGYDHSYFFISSFIEEHLRFHARHLKG